MSLGGLGFRVLGFGFWVWGLGFKGRAGGHLLFLHLLLHCFRKGHRVLKPRPSHPLPVRAASAFSPHCTSSDEEYGGVCDLHLHGRWCSSPKGELIGPTRQGYAALLAIHDT